MASQSVTSRVFCAVTAVMTDVPYTPYAAKVLRSAWMPAPPPESLPAMVIARATGVGVVVHVDSVAGDAVVGRGALSVPSLRRHYPVQVQRSPEGLSAIRRGGRSRGTSVDSAYGGGAEGVKRWPIRILRFDGM